MAQPFKSRH